MNELALFAGAGGGLLGTRLLGWHPVCAVEKEPYSREVLLRRQRDGVLPLFPIWDDVRTFDGRPWHGLVDVVTAGFPCQPFSTAAGNKRRPYTDERNCWPDTIRVIREVEPQHCLLENVPGLLAHEYANRVFGDLAEGGLFFRWDCLLGCAFGADHERNRIWILAHAAANGRQRSVCSDASHGVETCQATAGTLDTRSARLTKLEKRLGEPAVFRANDGLPNRVDRLAAIGDGQIPGVVRAAWLLLSQQ